MFGYTESSGVLMNKSKKDRFVKVSRLLALLSFINVFVAVGSMECGAISPLRGCICGTLAVCAFGLFSFVGGLIG